MIVPHGQPLRLQHGGGIGGLSCLLYVQDGFGNHITAGPGNALVASMSITPVNTHSRHLLQQKQATALLLGLATVQVSCSSHADALGSVWEAAVVVLFYFLLLIYMLLELCSIVRDKLRSEASR